MRSIGIILIILFSKTALLAQFLSVDSLIQNINNDQLYGTCHYAWVLEMDSEAGKCLIGKGNSIVYRLIPLLDNGEKGIIVHFILTSILGGYSFSSSFEHFATDSILDYEFNGLKFHDKNGHMFAADSILAKNKAKWINVIGKNKLIIDYSSIPLKR